MGNGPRMLRRACAAVVVCVLATTAGTAAGAAAEPSSSSGGDASTLWNGSLVIEGSPIEAQQRQAEEEARRASPEAVRAREESESAFEALGPQAAATLLGERFAGAVDRTDGGLPQLPAGEQVGKLLSTHAARLSLPAGADGKPRHGVMEALEPIAVEEDGALEPIQLGLEERGGVFGAKRGLLPVRFPADVSAGVSLPGTDVSLTPLGASGSAAASAANGIIDGDAVLWGGASMGTAVDVSAKPTTAGFDLLVDLRSQASPETLRFAVGMPQGASLAQGADGAVLVREAGQTLARILPPSAVDAAGTPVDGVEASVEGDVLTVKVPHPAGRYLYPLLLDPQVVDEQFVSGYDFEYGGFPTNWGWYTDHYEPFFSAIKWEPVAEELANNEWSYTAGQYGTWVYETQKESHIWKWTSTTTDTNPSPSIQATMSIASPGSGKEGNDVTLQTSGTASHEVCAVWPSCEVGTVSSANDNDRAYFEAQALESGSAAYKYDMEKRALYISQEKGPEVHWDTGDPTLWEEGYHSNPFYENQSKWTRDTVGVEAFDPGLGIDDFTLAVNGKTLTDYNPGECAGVQCNECFMRKCSDGESGGILQYRLNSGMVPEGEDTIVAKVTDSAGLTAETSHLLKYDNEPPHEIKLSGLPANGQITEKAYHLTASARDGSGATPSSGVASLELELDGRQIGEASGSCSPGPCSAVSKEWTIEGSKYAAGKHTLTVIATDGAGNVASESFDVTVRHATPVAFGPGSVNPESGEYTMAATDVSMPGGLTVSRSYSSMRVSEGGGPLGPQWNIGSGGQESLAAGWAGSMILTDSSGQQTVFAKGKEAGSFELPAGDSNLKLSEEGVTFVLEDAATGGKTVFGKPSGETGSTWVPVRQEGVVATETVMYSYVTVKVGERTVVEPTQELAPVPAGVSCTLEWKGEEPASVLDRGCRALSFNYASATTATGEAPGEWGDYEGDLTRVYYTAWSNTAKAMKTVEVAHYLYDSKGRLRVVWDPRISPALKTTYGYDEEGHVTAVQAPGQQPWLIHYGTIASDAYGGRVLSVARPRAGVALGSGPAPANTVAPTISGAERRVGVTLSAGEGGWSQSPLVYDYQWQRCNAAGGECQLIPGAVNESYTPTDEDAGHTLKVAVEATNAAGSTVAYSQASSEIESGTPAAENPPSPPATGVDALSTIEYEVPVSGEGAPYQMGAKEVEVWGQKDAPARATAIFPPDEPQGWPAGGYKKATIYYRDAEDRTVNVASPGGAIATSEYNEANDVVRSLSADNRAVAIKEGGKAAEVAEHLSTISEYNGEGNELLSTVGPEHLVKLKDGKEVQARSQTVYRYDEGAPAEGGPYRLVTKTTQGVLVEGAGEPQDLNTTETSYAGQEGLGWKLRQPTSTTVDPAGLDLVSSTKYNRETGMVEETRRPGSDAIEMSEFALPKGSGPFGITAGPDHNLWFTDQESGKVGRITTSGAVTEYEDKEVSQFKYADPGEALESYNASTVVFNTAIGTWECKSQTVEGTATDGETQELEVNYSKCAAFGDRLNNFTAHYTVNANGNVGIKSLITVTGIGCEMRFPAQTVKAVKYSPLNTKTTKVRFAPELTGIESEGKGGICSYAKSKSGSYTGSFELVGAEGGRVEVDEVPAPKVLSGSPEGIASGPNEELWFVEHAFQHVNQISTSGVLSLNMLARAGTSNVAVAADAAKDMWFTESGTGYIGKITAGDEVTGEYALPSKSEPHGITAGPSETMWFTDYGTSKIGKITSSGTITEYALPSGSDPYGITEGPEGDLWFTDAGTSKVGKITTSGAIAEYALPSGSDPRGIAAGAEGNLWFAEYGTSKIGMITASGTIVEHPLPAGSEPEDVAPGPERELWFTEYGTSKIGRIIPGSRSGSDSEGVDETKTVYYTAAANSEDPECGEHPEWAELPCRTQPVAQPNTEGLPNLPVSTVEYNMYAEPTTATSVVGSSTRSATTTYDEAGRPIRSETTSSAGRSLPAVTNVYSEATGAVVEQKSVEGAETKATIKTALNSLGQLTSYTDATGATTSYEYEEEGDMRLKKVTEPHGSQSYSYDPTTGEMTKVADSAAGVFEASYDAEGNMTSETYPNGMISCFAYGRAGEETSVSYYKSRVCGEGTMWFTDSVVPNAHGQWGSQASSLASESYGYDAAGRLTEVFENVAGEGCTTRLYAFDSESNRLSLTTRPPGAEGECATEGGTVEAHSYDSANRLTDAGVAYEPFGEIAKLPAGDAGGTAIESSFYVTGHLAEQKQGAQTAGYTLDPAGRVQQITDTGPTDKTMIDHYSGAGGAPSWTEEPTSGHWSRNIEVFGGLAAIQEEDGEVVLQLEDLQGNIIATASSSEAAGGLLSEERQTEYGVPTSKEPKRYGWLGKDLLPREATGAVAMGARSYIPQLGRFLQTDPQPGGSANAYAYTYGNPVSESDPTGEYTIHINAFDESYVSGRAQAAAEARAAELRAEQEEAERKAAEAAAAAAAQATEAPTEGGAEEAPEVIGEWAQGGGIMAHAADIGDLRRKLEAFFHEVAKAMHRVCRPARLCFTSPQHCEVDFMGHCSSKAQILARAKREYKSDDSAVKEIEEVISDGWKAYKEAKPPPIPDG